MKTFLVIFILSIFIKSIHNNLFCPQTSNPPKNIAINTSYEILETMSNTVYSVSIIKNKAFFKQSPKVSISSNYYDYNYCPTNYMIPIKEDYESLIKSLGKDAYKVLTDPKGLNMTENKYFLTKNKTSSGNFYCMYLEGNKVKVSDFNLKTIPSANLSINCELVPPKTVKFVFSDPGDINYNTETTIKIDTKYANGYLWRINEKKYETNSIINPKFTQSGRQRIELWANIISGGVVYLCDYIYVKKKEVSSSQEFSSNSIKKIETDFKMSYTSQLHFEHSNCPVSPRSDGGYYIAFTDTLLYLHVLSYDKNDNLIKDLNTTKKGYIHDIASTDYGFSIYVRDADKTDHSYLSLYNKNFELINTVTIMNNDMKDKDTDSNINKQIIKYGYDGEPVFGMRFMYEPDNGKLIYSRGRIFLIFCHYNYFIDKKEGHTGDTVATFNDVLKDLDFGNTWGASHSLIQSITFDDLYFWTAALSDAYPEGINVEYTSKKDFSTSYYDYDSVNKKYARENGENEELAGYITPYHDGRADGKLGGIVYFEKLKLYAMVYAKTPVGSSEENAGKNIMYVTLWNFENKKYSNINIKIVKNFGEDDNVMQLRAGKYGDNKLFIIYAPTKTKGSHRYGSVSKGTIPKVFVIELPSFKIIINDQQYNNLLMNTNEDLRTFADGVLIWAAASSSGNLTINKIGSTRLDKSYDDIDYILSEKDLKDIKSENNKKNNSLSGGAIFGIILGVIFGVVILVIGIFILYKFIKYKMSGREFNLNNLKNEMLMKY